MTETRPAETNALPPVHFVTIMVTLTIVIVEIAISFNSVLLPNLKESFQIDEQQAQMTLGLGLFALGLGGILYGAISESIGRKPVIVGGLCFFCIGTLLATISTSLEWLMVGRFLQGLGAGSGWIVGNACLKDVCSPRGYAKVMNQVHTVAGIVPTIAPAIGSYVAVLLGWRFTFALIVLLSAGLVLYNFRRLPETNFDRPPLTITRARRAYASLWRSRDYVTYLALKVLAVMLLFTDAANIPLIFVESLGVPSAYYGLYVIPVSLFYMLGSYLSSKFVGRFSLISIIQTGFWCILLSNMLIGVLTTLTPLSALAIQSLKIFTQAGFGMIFGNATAALISAVPKNAGAASALMIALEMLFSALGIYGLSFFYTGTMIPLCMFMGAISLLCLAICRTVTPQD